MSTPSSASQTEEVSLKSALAGLDTARATVSDAVTKLERTKIRSPIDGVILSPQGRGRADRAVVAIGRPILHRGGRPVADRDRSCRRSNPTLAASTPAIRSSSPSTLSRANASRARSSRCSQLGVEQANVVTYTVVVNARNPNGKLLPGMTANVEITADRVDRHTARRLDATRFQPPKDIMDAMREEMERNGQGGGQGGPGNGPGGAPGAPTGGGATQTVALPGGQAAAAKVAARAAGPAAACRRSFGEMLKSGRCR
jgi:HlyD family secretion protein